MSKEQEKEKASDKMIDEFRDKAPGPVDDAREGETDDNPVKETVRDNALSNTSDDETDGSGDHG